MEPNYFSKSSATFTVAVPVHWQFGKPSAILLGDVSEYAKLLPKISKEELFVETFSFINWTFGMENWLREASMSVDQNGGRYLDQAKFRENKLRYLLTDWSLKNETGAKEPLERVVADGRPALTDTSVRKVLGLDSSLVFTALIIADRVLEGSISAEMLYTPSDFTELQGGNIPARIEDLKKRLNPDPKE